MSLLVCWLLYMVICWYKPYAQGLLKHNLGFIVFQKPNPLNKQICKHIMLGCIFPLLWWSSSLFKKREIPWNYKTYFLNLLGYHTPAGTHQTYSLKRIRMLCTVYTLQLMSTYLRHFFPSSIFQVLQHLQSK